MPHTQFPRRLCAVAWVLTLGISTAAHAQTTWDLPTGYAANNFHTLNIQAFADEVNRTTAGRLVITVHPAASLFKLPEIKRAVQTGQAQIGEILLASSQNEWPMFGADALPFIAGTYEGATKLYALQRPALEAKLALQGLSLLFSVPWQPNGLYAQKSIETLQDMKGSKFRSYSPGTARLGELMGAQPVTVQVAELSQAFATGVADSMISSPVVGVDTKLYEHVKYFYSLDAWVPRNAVIVNRKALERLTPADQAAVAKAAATAESRGWNLARKANDEAIAKLAAGGMQVRQPSPALRAALGKISTVIVDEWVATAGPEGKALVDGLRR